jgi:hypothetical protein
MRFITDLYVIKNGSALSYRLISSALQNSKSYLPLTQTIFRFVFQFLNIGFE